MPYARYGETVESVVAAIEGMRAAIVNGVSRADLISAMPAGAARNAVDGWAEVRRIPFSPLGADLPEL